MAIARRIHLFPCRTQKLSFLAPIVVKGFLCESRTSPRELLFWRFSSAGRAPALQAGVSGSIPLTSIFEPLAQLVEHLTFNQRVTGSSPCTAHIHISFAGVAELADALDLGSSAARRGVQVPSPAYLAGLAQLVEHLICNQRVEGSSP